MPGPAPASFLKKTVVLICFFVSGSLTTVLINVLYHTEAVGCHHYLVPFRRPWFQNLAMFVGMTLLIFATPFIRTCRCPKTARNGPLRGWALFRQMSLPTLCDTGATLLDSIALLYLLPSVYQMFRGCSIIFTALLTIFYRHKKLAVFEWTGLIITVAGVAIVGASTIAKDPAEMQVSVWKQVLGLGLILLAQGLAALQGILEEVLLHDIDATEAELVSYSGIWGIYLSVFVTMPIAQILPEDAGDGLFENSIESFQMLFHSTKIPLLQLGFCLAVAVLNQAGTLVISFSSAVQGSVYSALRSIAVWVLSVIVYYSWKSSGIGEPLTLWSLLQGAGFLIMIGGTFLYTKVITCPCFAYEDQVVPPDLAEALLASQPECPERDC
jgi:drug/metabolite transporter (DMT)-like permease